MKNKIFNLDQKIHEVIEVLYFEESYFKMCKKFRYLSLFSVCLHFFKNIASYCSICSRVKDNNFFNLDKFQDLMGYPKSHHKDDYLFLDNNLNWPVYY